MDGNAKYPWGISESCYNAVDMNQLYQYGRSASRGWVSRELAEDLVIRALPTPRIDGGPLARRVAIWRPHRHGFLGDYGLYELSITPQSAYSGRATQCALFHATIKG